MNKLQTNLSRAFSVVFGACFLWVCMLVLFNGMFFSAGDSVRIVLGGCLLLGGLAALFFLSKKSGNLLAPSKKRTAKRAMLAAGFAVYLVLQIVFAVQLRAYAGPTWDFGAVARQAAEYVESGTLPDIYFAKCSNNIPLYFLLIGAFKTASWFGIRNFMAVGIALNIITIDLSILLVWLSVKKIKNAQAPAFIAMVAAMLALPLLSYVAVYYTDTLTIVYPILILYLWLCAKHNIIQSNKRRACVQLGCTVAAAAVGGLLKISVLIALIAVVVDMLLSFRLRRSAVLAAGVAALFAVVYFPVNAAVHNAKLVAHLEPLDPPVTYWIMMGLGEGGGYSQEDYDWVHAIEPEQRAEKVNEELARRLSDYGVGGFLTHIHEKNAFTWADGTFYSAKTVGNDRVAPSYLDPYLLENGANFKYYAYSSQAYLFVLVAGFAAAAVLLFRDKAARQSLLPFAVAIFGLFLFLMIWETRSRYLINYIPVFVVLSVCAYETLYQKMRERMRRRKGGQAAADPIS